VWLSNWMNKENTYFKNSYANGVKVLESPTNSKQQERNVINN